MRVLLKDQDDGSILVMEAVTAAYDPSDCTLFFVSSNDDLAAISGISRKTADAFIQLLFKTDSADLTAFDAALCHCTENTDFCEHCGLSFEAPPTFHSFSAPTPPSKEDTVHVHLRPLR